MRQPTSRCSPRSSHSEAAVTRIYSTSCPNTRARAERVQVVAPLAAGTSSRSCVARRRKPSGPPSGPAQRGCNLERKRIRTRDFQLGSDTLPTEYSPRTHAGFSKGPACQQRAWPMTRRCRATPRSTPSRRARRGCDLTPLPRGSTSAVPRRSCASPSPNCRCAVRTGLPLDATTRVELAAADANARRVCRGVEVVAQHAAHLQLDGALVGRTFASAR